MAETGCRELYTTHCSCPFRHHVLGAVEGEGGWLVDGGGKEKGRKKGGEDTMTGIDQGEDVHYLCRGKRERALSMREGRRMLSGDIALCVLCTTHTLGNRSK